MADRPTRRVVRGPAIGAYSSAVVAGDTCYVAGQAALDADGRPRTDLDVAGQTEVTLANLEAVLASAGFALTDLVKVTCYLADLDDWAAMDEVVGRVLPVDPPARATVQATLIHGLRVEMDGIAWRPPGRDQAPAAPSLR